MKYLVLAMRNPQFDDNQIAPHHGFLKTLRENGKIEQTGGFTDGSGGAYILLAENLEEATQLAHQDPLHLSGSSALTIYEWKAG